MCELRVPEGASRLLHPWALFPSPVPRVCPSASSVVAVLGSLTSARDTGSWQNTKRAHSLPGQTALLVVECAGHPGSQTLLPLGHEWTECLLSFLGTDVKFSSAL